MPSFHIPLERLTEHQDGNGDPLPPTWEPDGMNIDDAADEHEAQRRAIDACGGSRFARIPKRAAIAEVPQEFAPVFEDDVLSDEVPEAHDYDAERRELAEQFRAEAAEREAARIAAGGPSPIAIALSTMSDAELAQLGAAIEKARS